MAKSVAKEKCEVHFLPAAENLSGTGALRSLISNVAAKNLLSSDDVRNDCHASNPSVLILECSDISSILKTVERNSPPPMDIHEYQQEEGVNRVRDSTPFSEGSFDFHICNSDPVVLARIVVLLVLARTSDKDWPEGLELFWAVWGNSLLTKSQFQRFKAVAKSLAKGDCFPFKPSELRFPHSDDLRNLKSIWAAWAACKNLPSAKLEICLRFSRVLSVDIDKEEAHETFDYLQTETSRRSGAFANDIMALAFKPLFVAGETEEAIHDEISEHYVSGMIRSDLDETWSSDLDSRYNPNPTLLNVETWESCVQLSSTPFISFSPIDSSALSCTRSLHTYCMDALNEQLKAFCFWSNLGKLTLSVHLGNPLELALHRLPRHLTSEVGGGGKRAGKKAGKFDVIDAGTLVDSVGVLNVLLCCRNLLHCSSTSNHPGRSHQSRLITSTTEWYKNAPSLKVFLQNDMPFLPLHILPSFTGMSLITDFAFDSQSPAATQPSLSLDNGTALNRERVLSWRRVTSWTDRRSNSDASKHNGMNQDGRDESKGSELSPQQTPLTFIVSNDESRGGRVRKRRTGRADLPPCGLWRVLHAAFWHCCCFKRRILISNHTNHHTPLTWCLMVCHLSAQLDPDSVDMMRWQDLASARPITVLEHGNTKGECWLGLRAMIQYILTSLPSLHTPNLLRLFQCSEGQEGVVRYSHMFRKDMSARWLALPRETKFRVVLILPASIPADSPFGVPESPHSSPGFVKTHMRAQVIDNVRFLNNRTQITFCLPKRHGLSHLRVDVCVWGGGDRVEEFLGPLSDMEEIPIPFPNPIPIPPSPSLSLQPKLSNGSATRVGPAPGSGTEAGAGAGGVLQLLALCEFEEHYEATVKVPPQQEEKVEVRWPAGRTATWQVDITMESHVIPLSFLSPLRCKSDFTTASRGSGTVLCTFEKSANWPLTPSEISSRMIDMDILPDWTGGFEEVMFTLGHQFSLQQKLLLLGHVPLSLLDPESRGSYIFYLRNTVRMAIENLHFRQTEDSVWTTCMVKDLSQEDLKTVYICGRKGLKCDGAGRPVMEVVFETCGIGVQPQRHWQPMPKRIVQGIAHTNLLHELLVRNSTLIVPSLWQQEIVKQWPLFTASFLTCLDNCGADALEDLTYDEGQLMEMKKITSISIGYNELPYVDGGKLQLPKYRLKCDME